MNRDYDGLMVAAGRCVGQRAERMQQVVDLLWEALSGTGVSWIGFYLRQGEELVLGPRRDKPACSPIGLHGACGQSLLAEKPLVVRDVADLGEGYIACDPRDRSEVVVPLFDEHGECWGVLDADSFDVGAFDDGDASQLTGVLVRAGLTQQAQSGDGSPRPT
jgi:putative methionine-R-sulfoxide reductase with GAF domain